MSEEELSQALGGIYGGFSCEIENVINAFEKLQQENQQLHNKIDKAIEYIEDYGHGYDCTGDGYYCLDEDNQKDLLEILKDSDVDGR